jgi:hypothetical protein
MDQLWALLAALQGTGEIMKRSALVGFLIVRADAKDAPKEAILRAEAVAAASLVAAHDGSCWIN